MQTQALSSAFIAVITQSVSSHADTTAIFNTLCHHLNILLLDFYRSKNLKNKVKKIS